MRKIKSPVLVITFLLFALHSIAQVEKARLIKILGTMPKAPTLKVDTLERARLDGGWRYKLKYLLEDSNAIFNTPKDYGYAYLFKPDHKAGAKLPAIVAIHQDGSHNYLGYLETAGLGGDADQSYGLELFKKGYIVLCPNRFLHGPRRRISKPDTLADVFNEADRAEQHWVSQLLMSGRTTTGKEVYDLMVAMDVLYKNADVDRSRVGAVGHSAGGYNLTYWMAVDDRVKAGVSSCGVFEVMEWYNEHGARKRDPTLVIPGLAGVGKTADYIGLIAPRPFLMTRGLSEWGVATPAEKANRAEHVAMTKRLETTAKKYYQWKGAANNLTAIYFDENNGQHSYPAKVKEETFLWLDKLLK
jgi:dienelactone hydrolase